MTDPLPAEDWRRTGALIVGNPAHPSIHGGAYSLVVYDREVYESFRDQRISNGEKTGNGPGRADPP